MLLARWMQSAIADIKLYAIPIRLVRKNGSIRKKTEFFFHFLSVDVFLLFIFYLFFEFQFSDDVEPCSSVRTLKVNYIEKFTFFSGVFFILELPFRCCWLTQHCVGWYNENGTNDGNNGNQHYFFHHRKRTRTLFTNLFFLFTFFLYVVWIGIQWNYFTFFNSFFQYIRFWTSFFRSFYWFVFSFQRVFLWTT